MSEVRGGGGGRLADIQPKGTIPTAFREGFEGSSNRSGTWVSPPTSLRYVNRKLSIF